MIELLSTKVLNWMYVNSDENELMETADPKTLRNNVKMYIMHIFLGTMLFFTSYVLNVLLETVLSLLVVIFVRSYVGGHHFKSADLCLVITYTVVMAGPIINKISNFEQIYYMLITLPLIIAFVPYKKELKQERMFEKKIVMILLCVLSLVLSPVITISLFILSFDSVRKIHRSSDQV